MKDSKSFLKDGMSVFGTQLLVLIVGFSSGIILARVLGPEGKGILSSLLVYPTIIISFLSLGIRQSAVYYIGSKKYSESDIISVTSLILLVSSLIGVIITSYLLYNIDNPHFNSKLISLILLTIPADLTINYFTGVLIGKKQINKYNQILLLSPLINLLLIIFLIYFIELKVVGAVLATLLGKIILAYYVLSLVKREISVKKLFIPNLIKKMVSLGSIYALSLFILNLNYQVDIILLERLSTATEIGQYSIGVGFSQLLWQIPSAFGVVVFSYSSNTKDGKEFSQTIARMIRIICPVILIASAFLYYSINYVIPFFYGEEYIPSIGMFKIILPGIIIMSVFKILNMDMAGKGKPELTLKVFVPAVVINIALNIILIPDYGGCGAAFASTISYSVASLSYLVIYSKENQLSLDEILILKRDDVSYILKFILKFKS